MNSEFNISLTFILLFAIALGLHPRAISAQTIPGTRTDARVVILVYRYTPCLPVVGARVGFGGNVVSAVTDSLGVAYLREIPDDPVQLRIRHQGTDREVKISIQDQRKTFISVDLTRPDLPVWAAPLDTSRQPPPSSASLTHIPSPGYYLIALR